MKLIRKTCAAILLAILCVPNAIGVAPSKDANKAMADVWFTDIIEKEKTGKVDEVLREDAILELSPSYTSNISKTNKVVGKAQIKTHMADLAKLTSSITSEDIDVIGEGDKVVVYRLITTKYNDGKTIKVPWVTFFTFKEGKIASIKHVHDTLQEHQQHQKHEQAKKK
jgi:ketosteroid isomerase-like protein